MQQQSNGSVDNLLAGLGDGISVDVANVIVDPHDQLPFEAPPPPERRASARAPYTGGGGGGGGGGSFTRNDQRQLEKQADQAAAGRASPLLGAKFRTLATKFPGAERVRVRKKEPDGSSWMVGDWQMRELGIDDIEAFIMKYVKPRHGGGHYDIAVLDGRGLEHDGGFVRVMNEPEGAARANDPLVNVVQDLIQRQTQMFNQPQQPQIDPLEQMRRVKEFQKEVGGGGDSSAMMMMMMMQQQAPRGPDPMLMGLLQRMDERMAKLESAGSMAMPMPMPAAPSFDMAALTTLLSTVAVPLITTMLERSAPRHDPNAISKQDVQLMMMELQNRLMQGGEAPNPLEVARETIGLFRELHGGEKQQSLQEKLSEMHALRELAKEITGGPSDAARAQTNFWDAALGFLSNKGLGDGFGKMLGATMERRLGAGAPTQQPVVTLSGPAPQAQPVGTLPQHAQAAQQAPQQIEIPDDFPALMEKVETAPDDRGRIEAVVTALDALRKSEQWQPSVLKLFNATAKNERDVALRILYNWLGLMTQSNLLSGPAADRVMKSFVSKWDDIVATLVGMMSGAMPPQAPTNARPASERPSSSVVAAAPVAVAESDEEDEDEPEVEGPMDIDLPADMQAGGDPGAAW